MAFENYVQWSNGRQVAEGTPTRPLTAAEVVAFDKALCRELIRAHHIRSNLPPNVQDLIEYRDTAYWLTYYLAQIQNGPFCTVPQGEAQDVVAVACFGAWYANLDNASLAELRGDIENSHCFQYCPSVTGTAQGMYRGTVVGHDPAYGSTQAAIDSRVEPYDPNSATTIELELFRVGQILNQENRFVDPSVKAPNVGASVYIPANKPPATSSSGSGAVLVVLGVGAALGVGWLLLRRS